jgi:hypothetical protein
MAGGKKVRHTKQLPETAPAGKPERKRRRKEWTPTAAAPAATPKAPPSAELTDAHRISGITAAMLEAQQRVHSRLTDPKAVAAARESGLTGPSNIIGSYIGEKWSHGRPTGHVGVIVMVRQKHAEEHVSEASRVPDVENVHGEEVLLDVRECGNLKTHQNFRSFQTREIPALYGSSISLLEDGNGPYLTGSCGCLCLVRSGDDDLVCVLSNNHILANHNRALKNAAVVQQGSADPQGGNAAVVGNLFDFVELDLSNDFNSAPFTNRVDAAVAFTAFKHFRPAFHHPGITFDPAPVAATLNMVVAKEGRTTGTTKGLVVGLNATIGPVPYGLPPGSAPFAGFTGQIVVEGLHGLDFSQEGDSGSLICGLVDGAFHPVALLVGGFQNTDGVNATFGCPIDEVMTALNITQILDHEVE